MEQRLHPTHRQLLGVLQQPTLGGRIRPWSVQSCTSTTASTAATTTFFPTTSAGATIM